MGISDEDVREKEFYSTRIPFQKTLTGVTKRGNLISMRLLLLIVVFFLAPLSALAVPVSVEPWQQSDGNFSYSAIHAATYGHE